MKLRRRKFLRSLGLVAGGAVLGGLVDRFDILDSVATYLGLQPKREGEFAGMMRRQIPRGPGQLYDFDFLIYVPLGPLTISPSQSDATAVSVIYVSGTKRPVTLSLSGLPGGVLYSFSQPSGTPDFTSTLTISASSFATPPGTYAVTVTGTTTGGLKRTTNMTLVVK